MARTALRARAPRFVRCLTLGLVACLLGGAGLVVAPPAPASAAVSAIQVTITGTNVIHDWDYGNYTIKVRNTGTTTLRNLYLDIRHSALPLDFINIYENSAFSCQIVDGSALGGAKASCRAGELAAGQQATIYLDTHTTLAGFNRVDYLNANVYFNYPNNTVVDDTASFAVAVNP